MARPRKRNPLRYHNLALCRRFLPAVEMTRTLLNDMQLMPVQYKRITRPEGNALIYYSDFKSTKIIYFLA